ncbi:MAG: alpha-glucosidase, partial [Bacilli bacterium]|nr:alpha-glucosidase [Bacilli bacterium]
MKHKWWMNANIYQVYVRSFLDTNNDGIGDINGIAQKLEYIKKLGINVIWISPHYDSPMDDNGYDVRDFYRVSSDYGTIDDFRVLLSEAHALKIKVVIDLVLNHTSDEHQWFTAAKDPTNPQHKKYHDYYIWQPPKYDSDGNRVAPTRWMSWFGSSVWEYNPPTDEYYLHIFSKKMPDLNWRNVEMREDMKTMINWWIDLGIDGFRVDASNHLEKNWEFPDDFPGYLHFSSLPKHHEYLQELGKDIFVPRGMLTIGESGGATKEEALNYVGYGRNEFDLLIHFGHCWADVDNSHPKLMGKWAKGVLSVKTIKQSYDHWFKILKGKGWNVIYWHNHDQPRVLSHYGQDSGKWCLKSAKMLCLSLYFMPGTSICYQGEEIGMTNVDYQELDDFRDVEVYTEYKNIVDKGYNPNEALAIMRSRSRDNARSPMQWENTKHAGFTKGNPWIKVNGNYQTVNVLDEENDPNSLLNLYRSVLNYRMNDSDISEGEIEFIDLEGDDSYIYVNHGKEKSYLVVCNFREYPIAVKLKNRSLKGYNPLFYNTDNIPTLDKQM